MERKTTSASEICALTLSALESINHSVNRKTAARDRHMVFVHDLRSLFAVLATLVKRRYEEGGSSDEQARLAKALERVNHSYDELEDYLAVPAPAAAPLFVPNERKQ